MISPDFGDDDRDEYSLRPRRLREFIGQPKIKENLGVFLAAAIARGETLDHVLLHGPPGLGKTSLSMIIAAEMGASLRPTRWIAPWYLLLWSSSRTIRPADPALADMPMIATLRGRIMALMAAVDRRVRSASSFVVI